MNKKNIFAAIVVILIMSCVFEMYYITVQKVEQNNNKIINIDQQKGEIYTKKTKDITINNMDSISRNYGIKLDKYECNNGLMKVYYVYSGKYDDFYNKINSLNNEGFIVSIGDFKGDSKKCVATIIISNKIN